MVRETHEFVSVKVGRHTLLLDGRINSYLESGSGESLILLHGWPLCSDMFLPSIPYLSTKYRVVAPDLPGFGESEPLSGAHTYESLSQNLLAFIESLGLGKVDICGASFGAGLALYFASKYPETVGSLVLNSPPIRFRDHLYTRRRILLGAVERSTRLRRLVHSGLTSEGLLTAPIIKAVWREGMGDITQEPHRSIFIAAKRRNLGATYETLQAIVRTDFRERLPTLKAPVLVIIGSEDREFMPDAIAAVAGIPKCKLIIIDEAEHGLTVSNPEVFATVVDQYLNSAKGLG